jgi:integrating conjugative element protein (TIGR03761 family)
MLDQISPVETESAVHQEAGLKRNKAKLPKHEQLVNDVELTLHIKAVRLLCLGYNDPDKIGLLRFARFTHVLWTAAKNDDPYAEWRLMELYDHMTTLREAIKKLEERCQQRLLQLRGLKISLYSNPDPFKLELRFASPFSFMASCLIADLDYVERQFYTLKRLGLVLEGQTTVTGFVPKVQEILRKPLAWPNTGITRQDIRELNAKARQVITSLGEVPDPIMNKTLKFAFLPK